MYALKCLGQTHSLWFCAVASSMANTTANTQGKDIKVCPTCWYNKSWRLFATNQSENLCQDAQLLQPTG